MPDMENSGQPQMSEGGVAPDNGLVKPTKLPRYARAYMGRGGQNLRQSVPGQGVGAKVPPKQKLRRK